MRSSVSTVGDLWERSPPPPREGADGTGEPLGHEAVGVIEAVGAGVETRRVGDRVAVAFNIACGHCWFCGIGQSSLCDDDRIFGYGIFGGALPGRPSVCVPDADLHLLRIPDAVRDEAAVFVGDVLTTGLYGASLSGAGPDEVVAVLGCGPVGFCTIEASEPKVVRRSTRSIEIRRGWR